jgi:hypothetical protein
MSCYNDATDPYSRIFPGSPTLTITLTSYSSPATLSTGTLFSSFISASDSNFCSGGVAPSQTTSVLMSSWSLVADLIYTDAACNTASVSYPTSVTITAGALASSAPYVHVLGGSDDFSFFAPTISSQACEANVWTYQVIWSTTAGNDSFSVKSNLSVVVDSVNSKIKVKTVPDSGGSYNIPNGTTFTFVIRATLPNG